MAMDILYVAMGIPVLFGDSYSEDFVSFDCSGLPFHGTFIGLKSSWSCGVSPALSSISVTSPLRPNGVGSLWNDFPFHRGPVPLLDSREGLRVLLVW